MYGTNIGMPQYSYYSNFIYFVPLYVQYHRLSITSMFYLVIPFVPVDLLKLRYFFLLTQVLFYPFIRFSPIRLVPVSCSYSLCTFVPWCFLQFHAHVRATFSIFEAWRRTGSKVGAGSEAGAEVMPWLRLHLHLGKNVWLTNFAALS